MGYLSKIVSRSAGKSIKPTYGKPNAVGDNKNEFGEEFHAKKIADQFLVAPQVSPIPENVIDNAIKETTETKDASRNRQKAEVPPIEFSMNSEQTKIYSIPATSSPFVMEILRPVYQTGKQNATVASGNIESKERDSDSDVLQKEKIIINKAPEEIENSGIKSQEFKSKEITNDKKEQKDLPDWPHLQPSMPIVSTVRNDVVNQRSNEAKISIGKIVVEVASQHLPEQQKSSNKPLAVSPPKSTPEKISKLSFGLGQI